MIIFSHNISWIKIVGVQYLMNYYKALFKVMLLPQTKTIG